MSSRFIGGVSANSFMFHYRSQLRLDDRCCRPGVLPFGNNLETSRKPPERAAEGETFYKLFGNPDALPDM